MNTIYNQSLLSVKPCTWSVSSLYRNKNLGTPEVATLDIMSEKSSLIAEFYKFRIPLHDSPKLAITWNMLTSKLMSLSHFGEFDCDSIANQFVAQSQRIRSAVSVESQSMANPLRKRCELISTNVEEKKIIHFHDKKAGKIKEKNFI